MVIPDALNAALAGTGLDAAFQSSSEDGADAVAAMLLGVALSLGVRRAYTRMRGVEGLGLGDVKFIAAAATWTGVEDLPLLLICAAGAALGYVGSKAAARRPLPLGARIPFGPFLAASLAVFTGLEQVLGKRVLDAIMDWIAA